VERQKTLPVQEQYEKKPRTVVLDGD